MSSSVEQALVGLVGLLTNAKRPFPNPDTLEGYVGTFADLKREPGSNIIMQLQGDGRLDGGDSAHRTGVLSFCGSELDAGKLDLFCSSNGWMVRHPTQPPWNNRNNSSRDQLIGYIAGCWRSGRTDIVESLFREHEARGFFCQNTENDEPGTVKNPPLGDPLGPHDLMYFRICKGDRAAASDLVSQLALYTAIQTAPSDPHVEKNQILLQSIVCCQLDFLLAAQPNLEESLHDYWSGQPWRGQASIATSLWEVVSIERRRYVTPNILDFLLPANVLEELREIDWNAALAAFVTGNPAYFAELAGKLALAVLRDIEHYAQILITALRTVNDIQREIVSGILKSLHIQASAEIEKISQLLLLPGVGALGLIGSALTIAASLLGFGSSSNADDEAEQRFRQDTTNRLRELSTKTDQVLKELGNLQKSMEANFAALTKAIHAEFYGLVLNNLAAEASNAEVLMKTLDADPFNPDIRRRLGEQVDRLRVLIIRAAEFKADALPVCFHIYGILMGCLFVLGNEHEIEETKNKMSQTFRPLMVGNEGLNKTINGLANEIASANLAFEKCLGKTLVGAVSLPRGYQKNMDDTKDLVQTEGYSVTGIWCTLTGSFEPLDIHLKFTTQDLGYSSSQYRIADGVNGTRVFSGAVFETGVIPFGLDKSKYHSPDLVELLANELAAKVAKVRTNAGAALQQHLQSANSKLTEAKRLKPGYETLAAAMASAFPEQSVRVEARTTVRTMGARGALGVKGVAWDGLRGT